MATTDPRVHTPDLDPATSWAPGFSAPSVGEEITAEIDVRGLPLDK